MDNDKLDRLEGKFDRMLLLMEHMNKEISDLKQGQQEIKQHLEKQTEQLAAIIETVNTFNRELNSKITIVDKKVNVTAADIFELRAAK